MNQPQPAKWLPADWLSGGWSAREEGAVVGQRSTWLTQGGARRARVPIMEERHGRLSASTAIPARGAGAPPTSIAVGTTGGGIYLVTPAAQGDAPMIRQYRGHSRGRRRAAGGPTAVTRGRLRGIAGHDAEGLAQHWELAGCDADSVANPTRLDTLSWRPALVPSTVAASLRQSGAWSLDGPAQRFDAAEWWYRTRFRSRRSEPGEQVWLCFDPEGC